MEHEKRKSRMPSLILWGLLLVVLGSIVIMALWRKPPKQTVPQAEKAVPVKVRRLATREVPDEIDLPGRIEPFVEADLSAEKGGRIVSLEVDKGDRVEAGALLLQLDDRLWAVALRQAEIERRDAEREETRWLELKKTGAVSVSDFDGVVKRRELAQAAVAGARAEVEQCRIRSPISGLVDNRYVEEGEYVTEGMRVLKVVDTSRVKLTVDVPERNVRHATKGRRVVFTVGTRPDSVFTGEVTFVSELASRKSNCFRAEIVVDNGERLLRPGMIAEAALVSEIRKDALVVPLAAVIPKRGEHIVFVVQDGRAVRCVVTIDEIVGFEAVISGGLRVGDRLVVEGHRTLQDGRLVTVLNAE